MCGRGKVTAHKNGRASRFFDEALCLLGIVLLTEIGDQNIGTFARERDCNRAADAAVPASYDGIPASEFARTAVAGFAVVRLRAYGIGTTGWLLLLL